MKYQGYMQKRMQEDYKSQRWWSLKIASSIHTRADTDMNSEETLTACINSEYYDFFITFIF